MRYLIQVLNSILDSIEIINKDITKYFAKKSHYPSAKEIVIFEQTSLEYNEQMSDPWSIFRFRTS